ncbi:MAG: Ig-like domain-containing protein, partial [Chitinophagaceae bacterium]
SCANIIPPTGGPKDTTAPVLVGAIPVDSSLHFTTKKITLNFDEFVQLSSNFGDEIVVSPYPLLPPLFEARLKTVTIKLRDTLKPNTTYSIDFGKAIQDVNELNTINNFDYVFSTGNYIANGTLSGKVIEAETGATDSTLIVVLHSNLQDSAIKKIRPDYYAKLNGSGNFVFHHLPNEDFSVYVLPNDYSKKYDDSTKMFAFLNAPVKIDSSRQSVTLYAFRAFEQKEKPVVAETKKPKKSTEPEALKVAFSSGGVQDILVPLSIYTNRKVTEFDSSKIVLSDTFYKPIAVHWLADTSGKQFTMQYAWIPEREYILVVQKEALKDSAGIMPEKNDTLEFRTKPEADYGNILIRFSNLDLTKNPVLQFVQGNDIIDSIVLTQKEWSRKIFTPGDYTIRILYDENKNGKWDPGNFDTKKQPEITILIPRKVTVKANWDNEVDIKL